MKDKVVAGDGISISEGTEADENKVKISISGEATACSYTLDFQASAVVMNDINLEGAITITDIIGLNVDSLKLDKRVGSGLSIVEPTDPCMGDYPYCPGIRGTWNKIH